MKNGFMKKLQLPFCDDELTLVVYNSSDTINKDLVFRYKDHACILHYYNDPVSYGEVIQ